MRSSSGERWCACEPCAAHCQPVVLPICAVLVALIRNLARWVMAWRLEKSRITLAEFAGFATPIVELMGS